MTIQRQYSLPNCKLVLHGVSSGTDLSGRPLLSTVTSVECYLAGQKVPLTGGRAFLDSLAMAVSNYAQSYLSGIQHLIRRDRQQTEGLVNLQQAGHNVHRMTVQPEAGSAGSPTEIDLTTVQLFDLVEAVDQLYADGQTMPDLALQLNPLSKRDVIAQEPLSKRATPAAIGLSGLAAAAVVLFMLPVPEVRRPEAAAEESSTEQISPTPSPAAPAGSSPAPAASPADPIESPEAAASPTPEATTASPAADQRGAGVNLAGVNGITDPAELDRLTVQLYDQLNLAWRKTPTFDGELVYRVGVDPSGDIVGYKYSNDAALTYLSDTPLADVQFRSPASPDPASPDPANPLAQFRVVFKSDGVLEVSPWDGQPDEPAQ
jgi:Domain of unknown function (DUF4335)